MKELIYFLNSGSTCFDFEGAVKGVRAAITREEHVYDPLALSSMVGKQ